MPKSAMKRRIFPKNKTSVGSARYRVGTVTSYQKPKPSSPRYLLKGGAGKMKLVNRLESCEPLSQVVEIPDPALNDKLVPMNDNSRLTSLSRENFEEGSILA